MIFCKHNKEVKNQEGVSMDKVELKKQVKEYENQKYIKLLNHHDINIREYSSIPLNITVTYHCATTFIICCFN